MWIKLLLIAAMAPCSWAGSGGNFYESESENYRACVGPVLMQRYQLNPELYNSCDGSEHQMEPPLTRHRRKVDPVFRGNPKPRAEILANNFHLSRGIFHQTNSLVSLVNKIALEYLKDCPPVIYYDSFLKKSDEMILETLFRTFPITFYHGEINERFQALNRNLKGRIDNICKSYILFLSDPQKTRDIIGPQTESRVVLVARSSQWKLRDFLSSESSSNIVNLLVIGESLTSEPTKERPYVLYTHKLFADGLGSNSPIVLTSWIRGALSRPHINLFPTKFSAGFAGHSFLIAAANQVPFIFRIKYLDYGGMTNVRWDGFEYRLLNMIGQKLNFTIDIIEAPRTPKTRSLVDAIQLQLLMGKVDIGMAGIYITDDRLNETAMSVGHSRDCASFITLASKALPKYRAIMGPFQWPVWVALTCVYLGGIFPIVYSDRLTLSHLIGNWGEIENMFWYVFGMFTNAFTFSGRYSWSSSKKFSTRILIGAYWIFTIIITSCYTGSIIAFVTLPAFPDTVDSVNDLLGLFFRVGTLDNGGWERWFQNSTHPTTAKLYKKMEFVSTLDEGIGNVTQSFFWNYAFLGSAAQLEYLVQSNFSDENISRRSALHLSEECFALFQIGYLFPKHAVFKHKIDSMILLAQQSGLIDKINNEVRWTMQRSSSGKLLQASASKSLRISLDEERQLTTADTEGMFLLMGIGYLMGAIALISEIVGGITNKCRQIMRRRRKNSSAWSSQRNSCSEGRDRTSAEQKAHDERKAARRKRAKENEPKQPTGFGMREFNLTKTTLKELYGNYYKPEPEYVIRDGQLLLENEAVSTNSTECSSQNSSANVKSPSRLRLPHLRAKKEALVVAQIDVHEDEQVREALAFMDQCLESDDVVVGKVDGQNSLFGSHVDVKEGQQSAARQIEKLNLFNDPNELLRLRNDRDSSGEEKIT